ncbi:NACHT domain-containing protein [Streptomyces niger]|uniref:NACHT domain-containing protein n=1 Tax=Streptomyces niger TaxID=66373 RepID=UPI00069AA321|nr:NACHT domain-containing protein [Streptomyces niger]
MVGRAARRGLAVSIVLLVLAGGMIGLVFFLSSQGLERSTKWLSVFGGVLALAAFAIPPARQVSTWLLRGSHHAPLAVAEAAEMLAEALVDEWTREERLHQGRHPELLPVHWAMTRAAEAAMAGVGRDDVMSAAPADPPAGECASLHDFFTRRLPHRRLVVLGRGGGGKSFLAMRLARDLLKSRAPGDRVPVFLPLASWGPKQSLYGWVAHQLVRSHPDLQSPSEVPLARKFIPLSKALVDSERLLFVLDGFDEIPERSRQKALARIRELGPETPLVMTSRTAEYQRAVLGAGRGLPRTAVVELAPVGAPEAKAYLQRTTAVVPAGRWTRVFPLLDRPDTPVAQALQSPLMIWLAHIVYEDAGTSPEELANAAAFADRTAVEHHLLDELVSAAYADHGRGWSPEQARRWLGFLAQRSQHSRPEDLAWWQLRAAAPGTAATLATGLPVGCALGAVAGFVVAGFVGTVPAAMAGAVLAAVGTVRAFSPAVLHLAGRLGGPVMGRMSGVVAGLAVGLPPVLHGHLATGTSNGVTSGLLFGLGAGFFVHEPRFTPTRVSRRLRGTMRHFTHRLAMGIALGMVMGAVLGVALGMAADPTTGLVFALLSLVLGLALGIMDGLNVWIDAPTDLTRAISPRTVLRDDRNASLVRALVMGPVVTAGMLLATVPAHGPAAVGPACAMGVAFAVTDRMAGVVSTAWGRYVLVRTWLALRRKVPWRLMTFLADAHERGVLRQSGAVHQFRHPRLQRRLAAVVT